MKLCYVDETGTGTEPIAVMVGIIVDSTRMHVTKQHWEELLDTLSGIVGRRLHELHTRDFYAGGGVWKPMDGAMRSAYIDAVCNWLIARKHDIVYSSIIKSEFDKELRLGNVYKEINTHWRFMGKHLALSIQKAHQSSPNNKGNTILIFDNEHREEMRFTDLILNSPAWSYTYYSKGKKQEALDQIVDVPYFGDSKEVSLIQLADFVAFFIRRYAEIKEGLVAAKYADEEEKVSGWVQKLLSRSIGRSVMYPHKSRCECADLFYRLAPNSLKQM